MIEMKKRIRRPKVLSKTIGTTKSALSLFSSENHQAGSKRQNEINVNLIIKKNGYTVILDRIRKYCSFKAYLLKIVVILIPNFSAKAKKTSSKNGRIRMANLTMVCRLMKQVPPSRARIFSIPSNPQTQARRYGSP